MPDRPRPSPRALVPERIARHRDPVSVARARGSGALRGRAPALELYYEPGDPHSHLCAQLLPALAERCRVPVTVRLVGESAPEDYPEPERQRTYALRDAARIARAHGLRFPPGARLPTARERLSAAAELSGIGDAVAFADREAAVAAALFGAGPGEAEGGAPAQAGDALRRELAANAERRRRLGHYLPAMWQFDGDWFWGVDRLNHLEARLRGRQVLAGAEPLAAWEPNCAELPGIGPELPPLEFFYSVRSPYSYLALVSLRPRAARWPGGVRVRPVLPMAMRGIRIPRAKRLYTLRDVRREAERQGVAFGRVADPLGDGARRCLQVVELAETADAALEFLLSAGRAVWAEGLDVARDDVLELVCERGGIEWARARERLAAHGADGGGDPGLARAEENREALLKAGLWGVPGFRVGELVTWGQDRLWLIEELHRRSVGAPW